MLAVLISNHPARPVSKAYGVPTITFELGDETDRKLIGREAAAAMMETLFGEQQSDWSKPVFQE